MRAAFEQRADYKFDRYFPDCTADCKPSSLRVSDHVVRPGDRSPICRVLCAKAHLYRKEWCERNDEDERQSDSW